MYPCLGFGFGSSINMKVRTDRTASCELVQGRRDRATQVRMILTGKSKAVCCVFPVGLKQLEKVVHWRFEVEMTSRLRGFRACVTYQASDIQYAPAGRISLKHSQRSTSFVYVARQDNLTGSDLVASIFHLRLYASWILECKNSPGTRKARGGKIQYPLVLQSAGTSIPSPLST